MCDDPKISELWVAVANSLSHEPRGPRTPQEYEDRGYVYASIKNDDGYIWNSVGGKLRRRNRLVAERSRTLRTSPSSTTKTGCVMTIVPRILNG